MTTTPPQERRHQAIRRVTERFLTEDLRDVKPGVYQAEVASYIRMHLPDKGRTHRWSQAVSRWALMVEEGSEDDMDHLRWAIIQGSIFAHQAA